MARNQQHLPDEHECKHRRGNPGRHLVDQGLTIGDSPLILAGDAHLRVPGLTALLLEQAAACGCLAQPSAVLDQVRADALASVSGEIAVRKF